jgi:dimethylamine/trimethylamine dehydrogenase
MANVEVYLDSKLTAEDIREFGFKRVLLATGARWRTDGVGVSNTRPVPGSDQDQVFTPEDIFMGADIPGPVVVFDDDNFYLGGVIAEALRRRGLDVALVTTMAQVSAWSADTLEQHRIQARMLELGIGVVTDHNLARIGGAEAELACNYSDRRRSVPAASVVMVTSRRPNSELYLALTQHQDKLAEAGIASVQAIGDCDAPSTIAAAVYDGHRAARELDAPPGDPDMPFRREQVALDASV